MISVKTALWPKAVIVLAFATAFNFEVFAQSDGEVMFVGLNADGTDGISFVTFVPLVNGTTIYFNDNEWNGSAIGSGGAFNNNAEGALTWTNNTGNTISAGTVITIESATGSPTVNRGSVTESEDGFNIGNTNDVVYMFLGTDDYTPTVFLSAIANDGFGNGTLANTGLTSGTNATSIGGDEDVMVYTGNTVCTTSIAACAADIATAGNWSTQDTGGNDSNNGFPDFPDDDPVNFYGTVFEAVTYYSRNATSGGNWDDPNSWTTVSDGSGGPLAAGIWPASADNVVILSGHTITINAVTDNQASGISADGLARANVGAFTGSADQMFYHTADIIISNGGTLTSSQETMLEGYTLVEDGGTLTLTDDIINLGYLEISTTATFDYTDDLILSGNSNTIIDNTTTGDDDVYLDWTDATLCGAGILNLGNGGPDPSVQFFNGATGAQICSSFTITCTSNCGGFSNGNPSGAFIVGNTGPGGVGDQNNNELWLRANDLALANGAAVTSWTDVSGNGLTAVSSGVAAEEPTFNTNAVNGILPAISFDGGDYLNLGDPPSLDLIPQTDSWSFFIVYNAAGATPQGTFFAKATSNGGTRQYQYTIDDNAGTSRFTSYIGGSATVGSVVSTNAWFVSSHTNNTTQKDSWTNESVNFAAQGIGNGLVANTEVLIGARRDTGPTTGFGFPLTGSIAEIAVYDALVNLAQRIIATNYLAAKYNITLNANDVYDMDTGGNGDYDFEVAGVGQASDGSNHLDARGTGMVRMWNPSSLANNDFLLWGHDNGAEVGTTTDVDGTLIEERLARIWRVAETADVGTVSVSFDISTLSGTPVGSDLRLLIDRDGDGFFDNDVTPITGSFSSNQIIFSSVNFLDGDRFTLGNTNLAAPLPVELLSFRAEGRQGAVDLFWSTASETNNDYFTVERSKSGTEWENVTQIPGAGTSNVKIDYTATDDGPYSGASYYRLRQTDLDGQYSYSGVVRIVIPVEDALIVHPNPTRGSFTILAPFKFNHDQVQLFNTAGKPVAVSMQLKSSGSEAVIDSGSLPPGVYILQVSDGFVRKFCRIVVH